MQQKRKEILVDDIIAKSPRERLRDPAGHGRRMQFRLRTPQ
jgi:hypothetical protein